MYIINKKLKDEEILNNMHEISFSVTIPGKPENYTRERYQKKGNFFYNKKASKIIGLKEAVKKEIKKSSDYSIVEELLKDKENFYYVELENIFYVPIPKGNSKKEKERKEKNILPVMQRPDIDNYLKFILDSLHDVIYDDDCRVISESSKKRFSTDERTEINIKIFYYKED